MIRQAVLAGVAAIVLAGSAITLAPAAKPSDEKPRPKLDLLTETQEAVLRSEAVKIEVRSKRGFEVRGEAALVVDGYPEDYSFRLGPESRRLRNDEARVRLDLSARQQEVLAFAQQACDEATLDARAKAGRKTGRLTATLRSKDC